ncbi:MAG: hypothetical protein KAI24_00700 [Planctomycetes bacterium]|nr:hypothetical protein [Planctomycetota bacterium]
MRTILFAAAGLFAGAGLPLLDDTKQPPLQIELTIDGQRHELVAGTPAKVRIGDAEHVLVATPKATRQFAAAGVAFEYAAGMGFEYESDEEFDMRTWTLDGSDTTVLVYEFTDGSTTPMARSVLAGTANQFEPDAKIDELRLSIGGKQQTTYKVVVDISDEPVAFYTFDPAGCHGRIVVMIQDMLDENGATTAETKQLLTLLDKTFRTTAK